MTPSVQLQESLRRFVIPALAGAVLSGIAVWQASHDLEGAILAATIALLTPLAGAARWGVHDATRAREGRVQPSDVAAQVPDYRITQATDTVLSDPPPSARGG